MEASRAATRSLDLGRLVGMIVSWLVFCGVAAVVYRVLPHHEAVLVTAALFAGAFLETLFSRVYSWLRGRPRLAVVARREPRARDVLLLYLFAAIVLGILFGWAMLA